MLLSYYYNVKFVYVSEYAFFEKINQNIQDTCLKTVFRRHDICVSMRMCEVVWLKDPYMYQLQKMIIFKKLIKNELYKKRFWDNYLPISHQNEVAKKMRREARL